MIAHTNESYAALVTDDACAPSNDARNHSNTACYDDHLLLFRPRSRYEPRPQHSIDPG